VLFQIYLTGFYEKMGEATKAQRHEEDKEDEEERSLETEVRSQKGRGATKAQRLEEEKDG